MQMHGERLPSAAVEQRMGTQDILLALRGLPDDDLRAIRAAAAAILHERAPRSEQDRAEAEDGRCAPTPDDVQAQERQRRADEEARRSAEREALRCQSRLPHDVPVETVLDLDDEG